MSDGPRDNSPVRNEMVKNSAALDAYWKRDDELRELRRMYDRERRLVNALLALRTMLEEAAMKTEAWNAALEKTGLNPDTLESEDNQCES